MKNIVKCLLFFVSSIIFSPNVEANVLSNAIEWEGHHYKVFEMEMNWHDAKRFCESVGGHLATAETAQENEAIKRIILRMTNNKRWVSYWMGAYSEESGLWRWLTGRVLLDYYDWGENEPKGKSERAMRVNFTAEKSYWITDGLSWSRQFVCEWESAESAHEPSPY